MMFDGLDAEGRRDMGLAGARPADQNDVLGPIHELAAMQRPDGSLIDLTRREVEAREVLVGREPRGLHVIGNGADFALGQFGLEELRQHRDGDFKGRCALLDQIGHGLGHAIHFEAAQHDDDGAGGWIMTHDGLLRSRRAGRRNVRHWPRVRGAEPALAACPAVAHRSPCRRPAGAAGSGHGSLSARPQTRKAQLR